MKYDVSQQRLDLLRRIQAQDQQALGLLYDQLAPLVHTLILRILGDPTDVEDVLTRDVLANLAWRREL